MKNQIFIASIVLFFLITLVNCQDKKEPQVTDESGTSNYFDGMYVPFRLTADLGNLSENQKKMIPLLIEASKIMDELFWYEAYGNKDVLFDMGNSKAIEEFIRVNYGPWDRLKDNESFVDGIGDKPAGANFYPSDMTEAEFESLDIKDKAGLYTFLQRDKDGILQTVPYHIQFSDQVQAASDLLMQASDLAEDDGLKKYMKLRAEALLDDEYQASDMAWLDMKDNTIDVVIGPIETYEDKLYGYKAAHEAYVLIKDKIWSAKLAKYAEFLPELQKNLPVPEEYKRETPGTEGELNAYDVIYYAGDCNSGSKTIAINLPNDEEVQLKKGTRRLQLKNAMQAKFDKILLPIADVLIHPDQRNLINFNAFFSNTMFHEVAHGLGIKSTINGKGTVRKTLKNHFSAIEEGKADILGVYMIGELSKMGEIDGDLEEYYTTFLAGIFRSVRFGASSAHGKANMIRFNFFKEMEAFERDDTSGTYKVNFENMEKAITALSEKILIMQGNGDFEEAEKLVKEMGVIPADLQDDLDRLEKANIPVDIVFEQGLEFLDL